MTPTRQATVQSLFPNASASTIAANPDLAAITTLPTNKNALQATPNAKKRHLGLLPHETNHLGQIPDSKPQPIKGRTLGSALQRETQSLQRTRVRFIGYRCRPLDPDNFAGSCKDLLDGLRHAGLIPGDEPWRIIFQTEQEKVKSYKDEKTVIEIET